LELSSWVTHGTAGDRNESDGEDPGLSWKFKCAINQLRKEQQLSSNVWLILSLFYEFMPATDGDARQKKG
jgi:hypothetical protein